MITPTPGADAEVWGPYTWSVHQNTLTFKKAWPSGGDQGPTGLAVKPWRRAAASASPATITPRHAARGRQ